MTSATVNSTTTTFAYRGDGLRHTKTIGGVSTTFTWDIAAGLPVVLDDGAQYVYGAGLASQKQGGNWYYYLADGLGSTMAIVNASGTVQNSYTYDVYGKPTVTGSLSNEFDFAGQETDGSTGLQYLRARYMDPETGTFLSRDILYDAPIWNENPYAYANDGPCSNSDPTGYSSNPGSGSSGKKDCNKIYRAIAQKVGILLKRIQDYRANLGNLPETGPMSRESHRVQYKIDKRGLNNSIDDYLKCPGGGGIGGAIQAWVLDLAEFLGEYEHNLENLDDWLPISKDKGHFWDKLPKPHWPEVPDTWWDGEPFDPWSILPQPGRGPIWNYLMWNLKENTNGSNPWLCGRFAKMAE
jgi:RHS repeat-associated protein